MESVDVPHNIIFVSTNFTSPMSWSVTSTVPVKDCVAGLIVVTLDTGDIPEVSSVSVKSESFDP